MFVPVVVMMAELAGVAIDVPLEVVPWKYMVPSDPLDAVIVVETQ